MLTFFTSIRLPRLDSNPVDTVSRSIAFQTISRREGWSPQDTGGRPSPPPRPPCSWRSDPPTHVDDKHPSRVQVARTAAVGPHPDTIATRSRSSATNGLYPCIFTGQHTPLRFVLEGQRPPFAGRRDIKLTSLETRLDSFDSNSLSASLGCLSSYRDTA